MRSAILIEDAAWPAPRWATHVLNGHRPDGTVVYLFADSEVHLIEDLGSSEFVPFGCVLCRWGEDGEGPTLAGCPICHGRGFVVRKLADPEWASYEQEADDVWAAGQYVRDTTRG